MKLRLLFVLLVLSLKLSYSQTFKLIGKDTLNLIDAKGQKQGKWTESTNSGSESGYYKNNKREGVWKMYNFQGEQNDQEEYLSGQKKNKHKKVRRLRARYGPEVPYFGKKQDKFIVFFNFNDAKPLSGKNTYIQLTGVSVTLTKNDLSSPKLILETNTGESSSMDNLILEPDQDYKIKFSKKGFLSREFLIDTHFHGGRDSILSHSFFYVGLYRKFDTKLSPDVMGLASGIITYNSDTKNLALDPIYYNYLNDKFNNLDKKTREELITQLENSNNSEIQDLQTQSKQQTEEIQKLNTEKMLKEAEARANKLEAEQKTKALELLSKEKLIQQFKLNEQQLLSDKKEKEINALNQAQLISELKLSGQEMEIRQQKAETEKKKQELEKERIERELKTNEVKQQKTIRNFILAGLMLVIIMVFFVYRSLLQNKKAKSIIQHQKEIVESQKQLVEEKQKEILDSIAYAKRIQRAHLPTDKYMSKNIDRLKKSPSEV